MPAEPESGQLRPLPAVAAPARSLEGSPPVTGPVTLGQGNWLVLSRVSFRSAADGVERDWEVVNRRGGPGGVAPGSGASVDAVDVIAVIRSSTDGGQGSIVLVVQFCVEFPSGLVDSADGGPEVAALRELREETGYVGTVESVGPPVCYEPGLTGSCTRAVAVRNERPIPTLEPGEWSLQTVVLPLNNLLGRLEGLRAPPNAAVRRRRRPLGFVAAVIAVTVGPMFPRL
ncbi:MAG: hypothetical protein BJ554DRAFT_6569 [Olpidium bornovanus]|uniref:Nudix hydrolase domain-containing protein n=1 Tax=Olpidium bornovanus TaxID=278681 RepID=A0A8H7ZXQ9_9FUNG|nr:MAG: hypothetical protein BJ554DRAFT_6569 [Olpidium bornovanus]